MDKQDCKKCKYRNNINEEGGYCTSFISDDGAICFNYQEDKIITELYGIKTPDRNDGTKQYIWWFAKYPSQAWRNFFTFPDHQNRRTYHTLPISPYLI